VRVGGSEFVLELLKGRNLRLYSVIIFRLDRPFLIFPLKCSNKRICSGSIAVNAAKIGKRKVELDSG
jgi:hypothetical protein